MEDNEQQLPAAPIAGSTISPTGIWGEAEQGSHIFSYRLAKFIFDELIDEENENECTIDFGCGNGEYVYYFIDRIPEGYIMGYEGSYESQPFIHKHDLTKPIKFMFSWSRINCMSIEVWEHIPQEFESVYVDNITRYCNGYLILSVAVPGQEGLGHVNCRSNEYVIETITAKGFEYLPELTAQGRAVIENHCAYLRESLLIFKRK